MSPLFAADVIGEDWRVLLIQNAVTILTAAGVLVQILRAKKVEDKIEKNTQATKKATEATEAIDPNQIQDQMRDQIMTLSESVSKQVTAAVEDMRLINQREISEGIEATLVKMFAERDKQKAATNDLAANESAANEGSK